MRNQKLETELAYNSAKCNTVRQCGVITDIPHFIHNQRGVLFVAHKAITVRTSKISSCLSHIFLMYNPISTLVRGREEKSQQRGNTLPYPLVREETENSILIHLLQKFSFGFKLTAFKRERSYFVYLSWILFAKPEIHRPDVFV